MIGRALQYRYCEGGGNPGGPQNGLSGPQIWCVTIFRAFGEQLHDIFNVSWVFAVSQRISRVVATMVESILKIFKSLDENRGS